MIHNERIIIKRDAFKQVTRETLAKAGADSSLQAFPLNKNNYLFIHFLNLFNFVFKIDLFILTVMLQNVSFYW